jgi:16S rRNA (guanine1207-N2)-methyltransferase
LYFTTLVLKTFMPNQEHTLTTAQGRFILHRLPHRPRELLRAWDAADEYVLDYLAEQNLPPNTRLLIINDTFGALAVALSHTNPLAMSDSYLSQQATRINLLKNGMTASPLEDWQSLSHLTHYPLIVRLYPVG